MIKNILIILLIITLNYLYLIFNIKLLYLTCICCNFFLLFYILLYNNIAKRSYFYKYANHSNYWKKSMRAQISSLFEYIYSKLIESKYI